MEKSTNSTAPFILDRGRIRPAIYLRENADNDCNFVDGTLRETQEPIALSHFSDDPTLFDQKKELHLPSLF